MWRILGSVLGCGGGEGRCGGCGEVLGRSGKGCWGVGEVKGDVGRGVGKCVGVWGRGVSPVGV